MEICCYVKEGGETASEQKLSSNFTVISTDINASSPSQSFHHLRTLLFFIYPYNEAHGFKEVPY